MTVSPCSCSASVSRVELPVPRPGGGRSGPATRPPEPQTDILISFCYILRATYLLLIFITTCSPAMRE